jgi:hypothetical protein
LSYNCVDYTLELCRRAGVDVSFFVVPWWPSTPSNLAARIEQKSCQHEWELKTVSLMGPEGSVFIENLRVCKLCGLEEPAR